jgi:hypothetical protein
MRDELLQGCWDYPIPWPEDAYKASTKLCYLCGLEAPYWCNHCVNREDAEDYRKHLEMKWGSPLPESHILSIEWSAPNGSVICQSCYDQQRERYNLDDDVEIE